MKAKIHVTLREGVLDTQGKAVSKSLAALGFSDAGDVRIGKYIEVDLKDEPVDEAKQRVTQMCEKLLANTVIETYQIEIDS